MIAYFVYNLDSYSGAAQQALRLAISLKKEIIFFNYRKNNYRIYDYNEDIKIVDIPQSKFLELCIIFYYTIKLKIKIYHFHGLFNMGLILAVILRIKTILKTTLLGDDDFLTLSKQKTWIFRGALIKSISYNIALTNIIKEINSKFYFKDKIIKIPNGVLIPENIPTLPEKEDAFCFVGLICERKKTFESIKYFIDHYSSFPSYKMYVVGPNSMFLNNLEFSDEYYIKCKNSVQENGLNDRVLFTGLLSKNETTEIFKKSKALLFFSEKEGMPNVVLEAMANNCIPITTGISGIINEIFDNKFNELILKNYNENIDLVKIEELISNFKLFNIIKHSYNFNFIKLTYEHIYNELLKR